MEADEPHAFDSDDHDEMGCGGPPELVSSDVISTKARCTPSNGHPPHGNHAGFARSCEIDHDETFPPDDPAREVHHDIMYIIRILSTRML